MHKQHKLDRRRHLDKVDQVRRDAWMTKDRYTFDPIDEWVWKKYDTNEVVDIKHFIEKYKNRLFFIGTDSDQYPKYHKCIFTSVLIAYNYDREMGCGHGATIIRYVDKRPIIPKEAMTSRLTVEVQRSIEVCKLVENALIELSDDDNDYTENLMGISIDVNKSEVHKSHKVKDALVGMVMGYGWNAYVKPEAWAASNVADRKCKAK